MIGDHCFMQKTKDLVTYQQSFNRVFKATVTLIFERFKSLLLRHTHTSQVDIASSSFPAFLYPIAIASWAVIRNLLSQSLPYSDKSIVACVGKKVACLCKTFLSLHKCLKKAVMELSYDVLQSV